MYEFSIALISSLESRNCSWQILVVVGVSDIVVRDILVSGILPDVEDVYGVSGWT